MMSPRFAWPAAALLLAALVPTVANVYRSPPPEDPAQLGRELRAELAGYGPPGEGTRDAEWSETYFGTRESVSRTYGDLDLFAARTRDAKKLFHFPELALSYGRAVTSMRTVRLTAPHEPSAQLLQFVTSRATHVAVYALYCGKDPVTDPYGHLLSELPSLLMGNHEPWTLVYVQGSAQADDVAELTRRLEGLLAAACAELAP